MTELSQVKKSKPDYQVEFVRLVRTVMTAKMRKTMYGSLTGEDAQDLLNAAEAFVLSQGKNDADI